jgi:hypothetical protein
MIPHHLAVLHLRHLALQQVAVGLENKSQQKIAASDKAQLANLPVSYRGFREGISLIQTIGP